MQTRPQKTIYGCRYTITYSGFEDCYIQVIEKDKEKDKEKEENVAAEDKPKRKKTLQQFLKERQEARMIEEAEKEALDATQNGQSPLIILNGSGTIQVDSRVACYFKINGERLKIPATYFKDKKNKDQTCPIIFIVDRPAPLPSSNFFKNNWKWLLVLTISSLVGLLCTGTMISLFIPQWIGLSFPSPVLNLIAGATSALLLNTIVMGAVKLAVKMNSYLFEKNPKDNFRKNIHYISHKGTTKSMYNKLLTKKGIIFPKTQGLTHSMSTPELQSVARLPQKMDEKTNTPVQANSFSSDFSISDLEITGRRRNSC